MVNVVFTPIGCNNMAKYIKSTIVEILQGYVNVIVYI